MTQQEIIAGDVEISRIMGLCKGMFCASPMEPAAFILSTYEIAYHNDWNWLMAAWLHIKALTCSNMDSRDDRVIFRQTIGIIQLNIGGGNIEKAWTAISRFARWYNSLQTQKQEQ